jgi:UDP-N-acetylmuramoyl-tripeptide--D-alanyl-D-alanine ligase
MAAAIESFAAMDGARKVVILGDMYELEGEAEGEHRKIGDLLKERKIHSAYLCGPLMKSAQATFPEGKFIESRDLLVEELKKNPIKDSLILVKASRGMALEKVVEFL